MKIYLTRHGQTVWNTQGRMQGWQDSELTEKGIINAKMLGSSLKDINFNRIYSSPLGRAMDTAKYIKGHRAIDIVEKVSLKEMGFGIWEGMEQEKIKEFYAEQQWNFWNRPDLYSPVDGESFQQLTSRVRNVLYEIINSGADENVLVVTHTVVIKAIYMIIGEYELKDFWKEPYIYDTCLTILETNNNKIGITLEADISHLNND